MDIRTAGIAVVFATVIYVYLSIVIYVAYHNHKHPEHKLAYPWE